MNANHLQKICSVSGSLHGAVVQSNLEQAGIPATLGHARSGAYLDVLVPAEKVYDARMLLAAEPRSGETFSSSNS